MVEGECFDGHKILNQWLSCGYIQDNELFPTRAGTPQGGIISPTLANIALDGMEAAIEAVATRKDKANFVRYADDLSLPVIAKDF